MKKIIIAFIVCLGLILQCRAETFKDTVEAGSSDSIYAPTIYGNPSFLNLTFIQLDTNATFPDSVIIEQTGISGYKATLGFRKSATDSLLDIVVLTYATTGFTHYSTIISGWVWQPVIVGIRFRLVNTKYLAGRRILVVGEYE